MAGFGLGDEEVHDHTRDHWPLADLYSVRVCTIEFRMIRVPLNQDDTSGGGVPAINWNLQLLESSKTRIISMLLEWGWEVLVGAGAYPDYVLRDDPVPADAFARVQGTLGTPCRMLSTRMPVSVVL